MIVNAQQKETGCEIKVDTNKKEREPGETRDISNFPGPAASSSWLR